MRAGVGLLSAPGIAPGHFCGGPEMKKKVLAPLLLMLLMTSAFALLPIPIWVAGFVINNLLVTDITLLTIGGLSALAWYECGSNYPFSTCKAQAAAGSNPIKMQAKLSPTATRANPDPNKWNNPTGSARDVTPKTSFTADNKYPGAVNDPNLAAQAATDFYWNGGQQIPYVVGTDGNVYQVGWVAQGGSVPVGWSVRYTTAIVATGSNPPQFVIMKNLGAFTTSATCPTGYTLNGTTCQLVSASQVTKPATQPCEVLWDSGGKTFLWDQANTNCKDLAAQLQITAGKQDLTVPSTSGAGEREAVTLSPNMDGGFTVCQDKGLTGGKNCMRTGAFDAGSGSYPIVGTESLPGGETPGTSPAPQITSSCGGADQPACTTRIDETGTPGTPSWGTANGALETMVGDYQSRVDTQLQDSHGIAWSSLFPDLFFGAPRIACQPVNFNLAAVGFGNGMHGSGLMVFDFCSNQWLLMLRDLLKWVVYIGGVFYIWRRFMSAEGVSPIDGRAA